MIEITDNRKITVPQVAIAFCASKGIVPLCGCRKPKQVKELAEAANIMLSEEEINLLEAAADKSQAKIMGPDLFCAFVKNGKTATTK